MVCHLFHRQKKSNKSVFQSCTLVSMLFVAWFTVLWWCAWFSQTDVLSRRSRSPKTFRAHTCVPGKKQWIARWWEEPSIQKETEYFLISRPLLTRWRVACVFFVLGLFACFWNSITLIETHRIPNSVFLTRFVPFLLKLTTKKIFWNVLKELKILKIF